MLNFFDSISEWFSQIGKLILSAIEALITAIGVLLSALQLPVYLGVHVPAFLYSSVICVVSFAVVKFLLNR